MSGNKYQQSKLVESIRNGSLASVIEALDTGHDIEEPDMHGQRGLPLRTACFTGNLAIIRELIIRGADINAAGGDGPSAPLRLALRCRHHGVVALLIKQGAHIPEGVTINPEILAKIDSLDVPPIMFDAPRLPEKAEPSPTPVSAPSPAPDLLPGDAFALDIPLHTEPESTSQQAASPAASNTLDIDIDLDFKPAENVGEATRVMSMDLMRFDENLEAASPAPDKPSSPTADSNFDIDLDINPSANFGTETRMATMDLMRFNEMPDAAALPDRQMSTQAAPIDTSATTSVPAPADNSLDFDLDFKPAASFGTETRMVSLDLMRFNETPEQAAPPSRPADASNSPQESDPNALDFDLDFKPGANFGTETRMISLDLMRFNENPDETALPKRTNSERGTDQHPGDIEFESIKFDKSGH